MVELYNGRNRGRCFRFGCLSQHEPRDEYTQDAQNQAGREDKRKAGERYFLFGGHLHCPPRILLGICHSIVLDKVYQQDKNLNGCFLLSLFR